jgi:hypothetical protein
VLVRYRDSGEFEIRGIDANGGMSTVLKEGNDRFASARHWSDHRTSRVTACATSSSSPRTVS